MKKEKRWRATESSLVAKKNELHSQRWQQQSTCYFSSAQLNGEALKGGSLSSEQRLARRNLRASLVLALRNRASTSVDESD